MNGVRKLTATVFLSGFTALNIMPYAAFADELAPKQQTLMQNTFQSNFQTAQSSEDSSDCVSVNPGASYADGLVNLAKGKRTSQSSTYSQGNINYTSDLAVDGNTQGNFFSDLGSHTQSEKNAWWDVDLGTNDSLDKIIIWNRTDHEWGKRLSNFRVIVSDSSNRVTFERTYCRGERYFIPAMMIELPKNIKGQHIRVILNGTNYLQLAEVEVFCSK